MVRPNPRPPLERIWETAGWTEMTEARKVRNGYVIRLDCRNAVSDLRKQHCQINREADCLSAPSPFAHNQPVKLRRLHLLYHELRSRPSEYAYTIDRVKFNSHVELIARFSTVSPATVAVEVTFDDGHSSAYEVASPILTAQGLRARFFITVGWTGTRPGYMGWKEILSLRDAGHMIGAHGWSHSLLTRCSPRELDVELRRSKSVLEDRLGGSVTTMSLPGGRYNASVLSACQEAGYLKVYTSVPRIAMSDEEAIVGRVNVNSRMTLESIARLLEPESLELSKLQRQYCVKTAAKAILGDGLYEKLWTVVTRREPDVATETTASHEYSADHK
jgi:peptidoglycan/xylan/chitin deacetylase (PgdA/CDA1 family)